MQDFIISTRLQRQKLIEWNTDIENLIDYLWVIQAQDYNQAKWAIAWRLQNISSQDIDEAVNSNKLVRGWAMRWTLHVFSSKDIGWILDIVWPHMIAGMKRNLEKNDLNDKELDRIYEACRQCLDWWKKISREGLILELEKSGFHMSWTRINYILYTLSLSKKLCLGCLDWRSSTLTLYDDRIPLSTPTSREEGLWKLATLYFRTHGPATLADFKWWAGLNATDIKTGVEIIKSRLQNIEWNDQIYYFFESELSQNIDNPKIQLLAGFDEYFLGYKDRSIAIHKSLIPRIQTSNAIFFPLILDNGKIIWSWKRSVKKDNVIIEISTFDAINKQILSWIEIEAQRFCNYMWLKNFLIIEKTV